MLDRLHNEPAVNNKRSRCDCNTASRCCCDLSHQFEDSQSPDFFIKAGTLSFENNIALKGNGQCIIAANGLILRHQLGDSLNCLLSKSYSAVKVL